MCKLVKLQRPPPEINIFLPALCAAYPSNFLIDKKGVIRYGYRGALEWDKQSVVNTINSLL
jgi:peroxiredoxin